ncbi:NAD(P)-dependent oxidoreductase [Marinomonas sp. PE14-40]|uniref:NAD(P)-dependent oxidoreductase n=1 Tax=Marinomonas sp. PE14-40 TaxID=3060621 RepID=UPI003F67968B
MTQKTLALIGATGRTGNEVIHAALAQGYQLRVLARDPSKVKVHQDVQIIKGDALDQASLAELIQGADAVVSCLGPSGINQSLKQAKQSAKSWLCSNSTKLLIPLMEDAGIQRLILTTGASLKTPKDKNSLFMRFMLNKLAPLILGEMCHDRQAEYELLTQSQLDWTYARCGGIHFDAKQDQLKVSTTRFQGGKIHPKKLAHFLIDQVTQDKYKSEAVFIASC